MTEQSTAADPAWAARGAHWARTAAKGLSEYDLPNQRLIEAAQIDVGMDCLDIASGAGEPAISIAVKVGPTGSVTCIDANPEMLKGAQDRAGNLGLDNMSFEIGDMMELPFEDDRFDAVTCRFGLMFADDPVSVLTGVRRILKPGKRAAFMVHGPAADNALNPVLAEAVADYFGEEVIKPNSRRHRYGGDGEMAEIFRKAGFSDVGDTPIREVRERPAEGQFWDVMLQRSHGARLEGLSGSDLEALHAVIAKAFEPFHKGDHYALHSAEQLAWGSA